MPLYRSSSLLQFANFQLRHRRSHYDKTNGGFWTPDPDFILVLFLYNSSMSLLDHLRFSIMSNFYLSSTYGVKCKVDSDPATLIIRWLAVLRVPQLLKLLCQNYWKVKRHNSHATQDPICGAYFAKRAISNLPANVSRKCLQLTETGIWNK